MNETLKETIGFLSRWTLLLASVGGMVLVFWAGLYGGSKATVGTQASIVFSDEIWTPWRLMRNRGYLFPSDWTFIATQFIVAADQPKPWLVQTRSGYIFATVQDPKSERFHSAEDISPAGTIFPVRLKGLPYGEYAFRSGEAICLAVRPRRRVFAIDTRLCTELANRDRDRFDRCIRHLNKLGHVAMLYVGQSGMGAKEAGMEYLRVRSQIRKRYPLIPVVMSMRGRYEPVESLRHVRWTLRDRTRSALVAITGDVDLARAAVGEDFKTHLIAEPAPESGGEERIVRHRSWEAFAEWVFREGRGERTVQDPPSEEGAS